MARRASPNARRPKSCARIHEIMSQPTAAQQPADESVAALADLQRVRLQARLEKMRMPTDAD